MHHLTSAAPGARPRAACPTPRTPNRNSLSTTPAPAYRGHARLDAPAQDARAFEWRGLGLLALAALVAWLGWVALAGPDYSASGEPDATSQVSR